MRQFACRNGSGIAQRATAMLASTEPWETTFPAIGVGQVDRAVLRSAAMMADLLHQTIMYRAPAPGLESPMDRNMWHPHFPETGRAITEIGLGFGYVQEANKSLRIQFFQ